MCVVENDFPNAAFGKKKGMNGHIHVLIVEDDLNDAFFIQRAFQHAGIKREPHICTTVRDAICYLQGSADYADRTQYPFPNLLITDIKMPEQSGFDLLRWIRDHPQFQIIPTVIMSSSHRAEDVKLAYCLGANAYLCKPGEAVQFREMFTALLRFWNFCEIPQTASPSCEELLARQP